MSVKPLIRSGNNANIVYYRERDADPKFPYLWCEVCCGLLEKVDGRWRAKRVPTFSITVYRNRRGILGDFRYEPKTHPGGELSPRTVARLVRAEGLA